MNKKIMLIFIIILFFVSIFIVACPGLFDQGLNIDESKQCFILVYEVGEKGSENGEFNLPLGLDIDSTGNIYIVDSSNSRIQKFDNNGVFIESFGDTGNSENLLLFPNDITIGSSGEIYVTDMGNDRVVTFDSSGNFSGSLEFPYSSEVVYDAGDTGNTGDTGDTGDTGNTGSYTLGTPEGIDIDSDGELLAIANITTSTKNIIIYEISSGKWSRISKYNDTSFSHISDVSFDTNDNDNIYITEKDKHRVIKLKQTSDGNISSYEIDKIGETDVDFRIGKDDGLGSPGSEAGSFNYPRGITTFEDKKFFVSDTMNNRIQLFDNNGYFIEAWEKDGFTGTSPGTDEIAYPVGIAAGKFGDDFYVYIVESSKNRFKKFMFDSDRCGNLSDFLDTSTK